MELTTAVRLIKNGVIGKGLVGGTWVDLGAGSGLFTKALSSLLPKGSTIIAIDKKLPDIDEVNDIQVQRRAGDFTTMDFGNPDGALMANALHYVKDQKTFIDSLSKKTGRLVIVEYDTDKGNQWVPYPISFNKLKSLYPGAEQIGHEPSQYHKEGMYSALILF